MGTTFINKAGVFRFDDPKLIYADAKKAMYICDNIKGKVTHA